MWRRLRAARPRVLLTESAPSAAVSQRDRAHRRALLAADLLATALAVALTFLVYDSAATGWQALLVVPAVPLLVKAMGLYGRDELILNKTTLDEAPRLLQAATTFALGIFVTDGLVTGQSIGPGSVLGLWLTLFAVLVLLRAAVRRLCARALVQERCLVLGSYADAARVAEKLDGRATVSAAVVGRVPLAPTDPGGGSGCLGPLDALGRVIVDHSVDRVIVAPDDTDSERMLDVIRTAKGLGVKVSVQPRLLEVIGSSVEFDHLYGVTVMGVPRFGLTRSEGVAKRALDLAGAALLLVALAPLLAIFAALVRLSSPGPVFFRQERVGRDGRRFEIIKFRTMVAGSETGRAALADRNEAPDGLFKIREDPRVTRFGRFLRRSSLDELPQLINVLRGEMSLVGPRPLVPDEDQRIEGRHRRRLQLKPGMTGQWQVFGSTRIPLRDMLTIDYLYVANWSLWGDLKILMRTVPHVLARRGL